MRAREAGDGAAWTFIGKFSYAQVNNARRQNHFPINANRLWLQGRPFMFERKRIFCIQPCSLPAGVFETAGGLAEASAELLTFAPAAHYTL